MKERLSEGDLQKIESYLDTRSGQQGETEQWLRSLVTEVRALRAGGTGSTGLREEPESLKRHGDALLSGSGNRHGEHDADHRPRT